MPVTEAAVSAWTPQALGGSSAGSHGSAKPRAAWKAVAHEDADRSHAQWIKDKVKPAMADPHPRRHHRAARGVEPRADADVRDVVSQVIPAPSGSSACRD